MPLGYLCLVLHAHLPFVRHPEFDDFLEEDWLYEAITETYIPLLDAMDGLERDGADWRLTMSVTPPLAAMLADPLLQYRYVRHIDNLIVLSTKEIDRTRLQICPHSPADIKQAIGLEVGAGKPAELPYPNGRILSCTYSVQSGQQPRLLKLRRVP